MKKIKTLIPVLIMSAPLLTTTIGLTACKSKSGEKEETKHVSDVKVVGEVVVNEPAYVTFSIDSSYTLDLNQSTIQFEDANAEAFTLNDCEVNMTDKQITIPAYRVTSTKFNINLISMKINSEITLDEVKEELGRAFFAYEGKNLTTTYTEPTESMKSTLQMKDMNMFTQYTYYDPTVGETVTNEGQAHYLDQYKGWIILYRNYEQTAVEPVFSANECYIDILSYIFMDLDWDTLVKDSTTGAFKGQIVDEGSTETCTNTFYFFFNKNKKLDHVEILSNIKHKESGEPEENYRSNCYFDWSKSAQFDLWDTPAISECKNYFSDFTNKADAKILYSIHERNVLDYSYSIAFDADLSKYTTFDPTKPLTMKYKPESGLFNNTTKANVKVNNSRFLSSDEYSYDLNTNILTINANVLQKTDKIFVAIGKYYMPMGMGTDGFDTFIIQQPDSTQTNTVYFHKGYREHREELIEGRVINVGSEIGDLPTISEPGLYWGYENRDGGSEEFIYIEPTTVITKSIDVYPVNRTIVWTILQDGHIRSVQPQERSQTLRSIHIYVEWEDLGYKIDPDATVISVNGTPLVLNQDYEVGTSSIDIFENKITDYRVSIDVKSIAA